MPQLSGVIVQTVDMSFLSKAPKAPPTSVYVVAYRDGSVRSFTGAPGAADRRGSRYCYLVDTTEHRVTGSCAVPSANDAYSFTVEITATWKVSNPEAVVLKNTIDGGEVVLTHLQDEIWRTSRQFAPDNPVAAEAAARAALSQVRDLDEGVSVLRATARFRMDSGLRDGRITLDQDALQGDLAGARIGRLRDLFNGSEHAAILQHLMQHPDDTGSVLQLMRDGHNQNQQLRLGLLKELLDRNLITDADAQPLRDAILGFTQPGTALNSAPPVTGGKPPLALPAHLGSASADPKPAPGPDTGPAARARDADIPTARPGTDSPDATPPASPDSGTQVGGVKKWKTLSQGPGRG